MNPSGSGGSAYTVDSGQLAQHAGDVAVIAGQIEEAMTSMRHKLESLQGVWKGAAAGQYVQLHTEWQTAQTKVRTSLQDIGVTIGRAGGAYAAVEHQVMATLSH